ncbi:uncharacterized protein BKA78DRAFT_295918 [Phyllosticta capitalensis]|uniref:uncharacterized protein n=1 Tax=Phyllosticta capitalensis TaxID=121624 RepID=UPI00312DE2EE
MESFVSDADACAIHCLTSDNAFAKTWQRGWPTSPGEFGSPKHFTQSPGEVMMPWATEDQEAPKQQSEHSSDPAAKLDSLINYHGHTSPLSTTTHSFASSNPQAVKNERLLNTRQSTLFPHSPKNITMEDIDPARPGNADAAQQQERPLRPSPITLEMAEKDHEHPLEWTVNLSASWYPEYSATAPEVCLWASAPRHIQERHWVKAASPDSSSDALRVATVLRQADSTLYEVPTNVGLLYPHFARGYPVTSRRDGPHELFPSGSKGLKQLDLDQVPPEDLQGARYIAAGYHFVPSPSKLSQMVTAIDLESEETASRYGQGRTFGVKGGFRPRALTLNHANAAPPLVTPWVSDPEFEADMEDVPLTSPPLVPEDLLEDSPPSSPPRFDDESFGEYYGPINQFTGDLSDDSDASIYSDDMDPFLDYESSVHAEPDLIHNGSDDQEELDEEFELESMGCWSTTAHVRLDAATEDQRQDLTDSIHDNCDHAHFATDKPEQLVDLPPGYRWTAHSFALHHSGPRLIVYAPPADEDDFDDRVSDFGSDGTSEFASSPVKMMQGNRPALWSAPILEEEEEGEDEEPESDEPFKTLYEGFLDAYGSEFGQDNGEAEFASIARPFPGVLSLMSLLGELFQPTTPSL